MAAGAVGTCQPNGYCSFPDAECPSGQRYGELAGGGFAGLCVEETGTGSGGLPGTTSQSGDSTTGTMTTLAVDDGSTSEGSTGPQPMTTSGAGTTGESTTTGGSTGETTAASESDGGSTAGSSSTGVEPACEVSGDAFDDGVIAPEWMVVLPGLMNESGDNLTLTITSDSTDGYPQIRRMPVPWDLSEGYLRMEVGAAPSQTGAQLWIGLFDSDLGAMSFIIQDGQLLGEYAPGFMDGVNLAAEPYDADAHRWIGIRFSAGQVYFEVSPDGVDWSQIADADLPFSVASVVPVITAGNYEFLPVPELVSVETFEMCANAG